MARPALTDHNNDEIRQSLIDAAYTVFVVMGEQQFSLRKVAQLAEVSHTYVYRYFEDKDALLTQVRVRCFNDLYAYIVERDDETASPVTRIKNTLNAMHQYAKDKPHNYHIMYTIDQPAVNEYPELEDARHKLFSYAAQIARLASEQGAIKTDYVEFSHVAWATIHGLISLDATHNFNLGKNIDELKDATWTLFFNKAHLNDEVFETKQVHEQPVLSIHENKSSD